MKDSSLNNPVSEFDRYARTYRDEISSALGVFGRSAEYFAEYKVRLASRLVPTSPSSILDFGCGVGESVPYFQKWFPGSGISGFDVSAESLIELKSKFPAVDVFTDFSSIDNRFDLVFVSNVLHHIEPSERYERLHALWKLVNKGGSLCVFEHNPLNPITRRIVSNCVLDDGVELLSRRELRSLVRVSFGPQATRSGYCLFFPPSLRVLSVVEPFFASIPLGGQHFTLVTKTP